MAQIGKITLKTLVIDDSLDDVELMIRELRQSYKMVWQRVDTEASLIVALTREWDVIISDFKMPHLSVEKVLEVVRSHANNIHTPIIVISGVVDESTVIHYLKLGINDFISKDRIQRLRYAVAKEISEEHERASEELRTTILMQQSYDATILAWGQALEMRDHNTSGHTSRVTDISLRLAREFGVSSVDFINLHRGGLLHDVGKMGIPDMILHKPEALDMDELKIMQKHPVIAYNMLRDIPFLKEAILIPYCHHERWNGTGYPQGLKGKDNPFPNGMGIPFLARLFSVVDVYDALTSDRPYRKAWDKVHTIGYIIDESGITFDPDIVEKFVDMIGRG